MISLAVATSPKTSKNIEINMIDVRCCCAVAFLSISWLNSMDFNCFSIYCVAFVNVYGLSSYKFSIEITFSRLKPSFHQSANEAYSKKWNDLVHESWFNCIADISTRFRLSSRYTLSLFYKKTKILATIKPLYQKTRAILPILTKGQMNSITSFPLDCHSWSTNAGHVGARFCGFAVVIDRHHDLSIRNALDLHIYSISSHISARRTSRFW